MTHQQIKAMALAVKNEFIDALGEKSDRSHVVLWAKELERYFVFLRPLGLRLSKNKRKARRNNDASTD